MPRIRHDHDQVRSDDDVRHDTLYRALQCPETLRVTARDVRRIGREAPGRFDLHPLVVDDALAGRPPEAAWPVLRLLERFSSLLQIVYLTGDPAVEAWAERLDPGVVSVQALAVG